MRSETSATQSLRMFINGEWVESASRETITSIDPANRQPVAEVPRGKGEDVDLAVEAARRAFESPEWSEMAPAEDRKSTRLNSSHANISYAVFCLKKKKSV